MYRIEISSGEELLAADEVFFRAAVCIGDLPMALAGEAAVQIQAAIDAMQPYTTVDGLKCRICFELATDPAPPSCGHIFCLKCINHALREPFI